MLLLVFATLIFSSEILALFDEVKRRLYSTERSVCLRRDLRSPFDSPQAAVKFRITPLNATHAEKLFELESPNQNLPAVKDLINRLNLYRARIGTCYAAVDEAGEPCYMQWLIGPRENQKLRELYRDGILQLRADEMLLEGAFTRGAFRGKGIMAAAMAHIAENGKRVGARWVVTVVKEENTPSLKGCKKAGFEPYMLKTTQWRFFKSTSRYDVLPGSRV
jgi:GNAT superfamily N-acetyltransferase